MDDQSSEKKFFEYASNMLFQQQRTLESINAKLTWVAVAAALAIIGGIFNAMLLLIQ